MTEPLTNPVSGRLLRHDLDEERGGLSGTERHQIAHEDRAARLGLVVKRAPSEVGEAMPRALQLRGAIPSLVPFDQRARQATGGGVARPEYPGMPARCVYPAPQ
jgi:hypothetical protein